MLKFFWHLAPCVAAMEAGGGAHFRGRAIGKLGHDVRLIPPACVKPCVKRKNDAAAAGAICDAAQRPTMRCVPVTSETTQGAAMVFRVRERLIGQRTQAINVLNRRGFTGAQNTRRIAPFGTDTEEEDCEAVFTRVPRACGSSGDGTPR